MARKQVLGSWLRATAHLAVCAGVAAGVHAATPTDNPVAAYGQDWTEALPWASGVSIVDMPGDGWDAKLEAAQDTLVPKGGVVYLPPGTYAFKETIRLKNGIVLRGAPPVGVADARQDAYALPTKIVFPTFAPSTEGEGTPKDSAFKGIHLADPVGGSNCGVVNLDINHGHVELGFSVGVNDLGRAFPQNFLDSKCGSNLVVYGCILRNSAILDDEVPMACQNPWQRWTQRHHGAIEAAAARNVLIANNRIPKSGDDDFTMSGYKLCEGKSLPKPDQDPATVKTVSVDVRFDYDNRPGISVNYVAICNELTVMDRYREIDEAAVLGAAPTTWPHKAGFAPGIVIRDNYVYCSGCTGIRLAGHVAHVAGNVIRYAERVVRETANGRNQSLFTNNNRAIELRGWRWTVENNDFEIYSNVGPKGNRFGDGEGIMHEAFNNVDLRDSKLIGNKGNAYLCIWRVPVNGLLIQGNDIKQKSGEMHGIGPITVLSCKKGDKDHMPCEGVRILDNITEGSGIEIVGVGTNNVIRGNRSRTEGAKIDNRGNAVVENNEGYVAGRLFE